MSAKTPAPVTVTAEPLARATDRLLIPASAGVPTRPPSDLIFEFAGHTFGQVWSVSAIAPVGTDKASVEALVRSTISAQEAVFDRTQANSEIQRFNAAPTGFWALSDSLWGLLDATMDMGDETDGAVDPTLGGLLDLWADDRQPDAEALERARPLTGWQGLRMNRPAQAALQPGGLTLDFEPVIAGHLVDAISDRLSQSGATAHRVQVGPVVRGVGVRPDAQPWWAPVPGSGVAPLSPIVVALVDQSLAWVDRRDGGRILDGRNLGPLNHELVVVSVFDRSAFRAQALARALMVMGPFDGAIYAEALGVTAHFLTEGPRGPEERVSPALTAQIDAPTAHSA